MTHIDVVSDILAAAIKAYPRSEFVQSLSHQYLVRGHLSWRQLEGLYKKAQGIDGLAPAKLATLEAILLKRAKKSKQVLPAAAPLFQKDETLGAAIAAILERYPQHKQVRYFQSKYEHNEPLSPKELAELKKFQHLLLK